jgi:ABC-2 type transport system ATP-binding protein
MASLDNIIETFDLTRRFDGLTAVDKLNVAVSRGEVFGLLGPNGAGKTTTISMLCTILKPSSGTARVNGFDIVKQDKEVRRSIGIVFQDPSIDDRLTGRENLFMHANLYGVPAAEQKSRIDRVLKLVELEERADDILRTYSGGMRRRLEIARGLIHYPRVLFLDEPTIGLDPQTREHIWSYVEELKRQREITIVLTTHYMDEADRLSDRIAIMDYGKIVVMDNPSALKETLHGDVITVRTEQAKELSAALVGVEGVVSSAVADGKLEVTVKNGESLLPRVAEVASKNGVFVESLSLREPNLEDVFLHYTGHAIRREGGDELHGMSAIRRRAIR